MTKRRPALSAHAALGAIVGRIGWTAAIAVTGRRERSIRKWGEPDVEPGVPLEQALALDIAYIEATGAAVAPFEAWYNLQLQLARARTRAAVASPHEQIAIAHKEVGEAFAARALACSPGAGAAEARLADRETDEALAALAMTRTPRSSEARA